MWCVQAEAGQACDGTGHGCRDGLQEHIAILDVAEFMSEHALQFILVKHVKQPLGDTDDGMLGIAPGCKRVWLLLRGDADRWHRQAGALSQFVDDGVQFRCLFARNGLRLEGLHHLC